MNNPAINVNSEIGTLKSVLLKRPGAEVENITPDTMERLLFDDIFENCPRRTRFLRRYVAR